MPLFHIDSGKLNLVRPRNFDLEREIQQLIERNLETVFNCRFVASEFSTGAEHAGRIDTLALSEDHNPVIIEYKKFESSELINQSLFYLSWIKDHRGDFGMQVLRTLGPNTEIDWSDVRVICIAPGYKKYDLHAVQMMGANIELWQYRVYENGAFFLEEVFRRSASITPEVGETAKNPIMVAAGKKAVATRASGNYSIKEHLDKAQPSIRSLAEDLREFILGLDTSIEEAPKKFYVAYKLTQNFVCMEVQRRGIGLYLKLDPSEVQPLPTNARDVRAIGHFGTGDLELSISTAEQVEESKPLIQAAFARVGGS